METTVHQNEMGSWNQRISWPAVIAGLILAVFIQLALTLLGVAIGMSKSLAIGSGIYSVVTLMFSLFTGGWVAGRLAKDKHTSESVIHGVLVAGLLFIITFYLLSNAFSKLIGSVTSTSSSTISNAAPVVSDALQDYEAGDAQLSSDSVRLATEAAERREEAKARALQMADEAAEATGKAALYAFFGIFLGTMAAGFGAKKGRDSKVPDDYYNY